MYADIIIDITHEKLDKIFQYKIPHFMEQELRAGMEVTVPFGMGNRITHGYVVGLTETVDYDENKIKEIKEIVKDKIAIESCLISLAAWMKENYGGTMIQALKTVLPVKKTEHEKQSRTITLQISEEEGKKELDLLLHKNQKARARLLAVLLDQKEIDYSKAVKEQKISAEVVRALEEKGLIRVTTERVYRNPISNLDLQQKEISFNEEQEKAIRKFSEDYDSRIRKTYLLYGVTGSGKTEVYIEMIRKVVENKKQAIVLIPEIALTHQTVTRFYRVFGNRVSIMNSKLSAGERYDQMMRAKRGEIDVMIGPRSALFTPFSNLGLIIIDEEHEPAYKSEQVPRYHARETAQKRAEMQGASLVLGSATPSMEAFYRCQTGEYELLKLSKRIGERSLPQVYVSDMRDELRKGNRSIFSDKLQELMEERLEKRQQTMLFINRRGYAGFLSCRACGYVVKCPHCDVAMSAHKNGKMICHYCGHEEQIPKVCPQCGSRHIAGFKAGTQQIEDMVHKEFPQARVMRMDLDTARGKEGYAKLLTAFAGGEADVLVGTQMIVKGHDFPNVTLVGILAADISLYADDYCSAERTFQLLTQAAGRAGRGMEPGEVVVQSYNPEHYSIQYAVSQDYEGFFEEEMNYRSLMGYPPAAHMLAILIAAENEELLDTGAHYLKEYALRVAKGRTVSVIGPATPYVSKVKDVYRRIIYLKHESYDILIDMKNKLEKYIEVNKGFDKIWIQFDFDPVKIF